MTNKSAVHKLIASAKDGQKNIPVLKAVTADPHTTAMFSKMVGTTEPPQYDRKGNRTVETPSLNTMRELSRRNSRRSKDADNLISMLPDIELAKQILVSSILSPTDMITTSVTFNSDDKAFSSTLYSTLISKVQSYFEEKYDFRKKLSDVLEAVLFTDGSYPVAVLAENAVDEFINGGMEPGMESGQSEKNPLDEFFNKDGTLKPLGILNGPKAEAVETFGLESFNRVLKREPVAVSSEIMDLESSKLSVIDNYNILKIPNIESKQRERLNSEHFHAGLEAVRTQRDEIETTSDRELERLLYRQRRNPVQAIRAIKNEDQLQRTSITEPLVYTFPACSVIPVYVPGEVKRHVGYYVLLDRGYPISNEEATRFGGSMLNQYQGSSFVSNLISRAKAGFDGEYDCNNRLHQDIILKTYSDIVSADLVARARNSNYGASARIASNPEAFRIMLARDMEQTQTQVLFLPASVMTYFALDYDEFGIGRSLIDKYRTIGMLRSVLLFANVKAAMRNSVGRVKVDVNIDETDIDPLRRGEEVIGEFLATRQTPISGVNLDSYDVAEYVAQAGYEFNLRHPKLPSIDLDVNEVSSSHVKPDDELSRTLRETHHMGFGLTSELMDQVNQPEHATGIVNRSILLAKRVTVSQEHFNPQISSHYRQYAFASTDLIHTINQTLSDQFEDIVLTDDLRERGKNSEEQKDRIVGWFTKHFLESLEVRLPSPDTTSLENQYETLETYSKILDLELENWLSDEVFDANLAGELGGNVSMYRGIIKAHFMRLKMADMGVDTGVSEFFTSVSDDISVNSVLGNHADYLSRMILMFAKHIDRVKDLRESSDKAAQALAVEPSGFGGSGGGGGGGGFDDSDGLSDDGDEDFDSIGLDDPDDEDPDNPEGGEDAEGSITNIDSLSDMD